MGLGKAVDEYARISHRRSRSSTRLNELHCRSTSAVEPDLVDAAETTDDPERITTDVQAGPRARPAFRRMCVCMRGACSSCACVLLPPLPRILFEKQVWTTAVALAVPLLIHWFLSHCSILRFSVSCAAMYAMAKLSKRLLCCYDTDAGLDGQLPDAMGMLQRQYPVLVMTDRQTDVSGDRIEELYHAEDRTLYRREREMMAHVERFAAWYGLKESSIGSIADAYGCISKLACEMHLDRRHRHVSSVDEALEAVDVIARHLGAG